MSEENDSNTPPADAGGEEGSSPAAPTNPPASETPVVPSYSSPFDIYGDDGVKQEHIEKIPEQYSATRNFFSKYKSLEALDQGIKHQGYLNSMKGFERPGPDASETEIQKFNQTLKSVIGVPDTIQEYGVERPENVSEEDWNKLGLDEYLQVAMENNISPSAFQKLLELDMKRASEVTDNSQEEMKRMRQADIDNMRQKHGTHWDTMEANAARTAELVKLDPAKLENPQNLTKGELVEMLAEVGKLTGESRLPNSNSSNDANQSKGHFELAQDIQSNKSNPLHADYMGENGQEAQKRAVAEVTRLTTLHARQQNQQKAMGGSR